VFSTILVNKDDNKFLVTALYIALKLFRVA